MGMELRYVALLYGPDQPGLVARISGWIFEHGGNILHADQHHDHEAGIFFQRIEWAAKSDADIDGFRQLASGLGMKLQLLSSQQTPQVAVFVTKEDHCFHDLVLRWKSGEYPGNLAAVISNQPTLSDAAKGYGLPFYCVPVADKPAGEQKQLAILCDHKIDLIVLARYMQILSGRFLAEFGHPVINIHHSFLPAFAGAHPYRQAYARGVKVIGATAHYATVNLDEGPIIHQDVMHVTHRNGVNDLVRMGRDIERRVLAQAVYWHLAGRVMTYGNKTVVFD
jgi:formyltetrahydrofolate deformylase